MTTTKSIISYGTEIWGDTLGFRSKREVLKAVQFVAALRVASTYRTISRVAVFVRSGEISVYLLAQKRKVAWNAMKVNLNISIVELISPTIQYFQ